MLGKHEKGISVFLISVIIFSFFNIIAIAPKEVSADVQYYCIQTKENSETGTKDYCVPGERSVLEPLCEGSVSMGNPEDNPMCQLGTCIPADGGVCLSNIAKLECESNGGTFSTQAKESVPQCQLGCCITGGICTIKEKNECVGEHNTGITTQTQCTSSCVPPQMGCCEMIGECAYTYSDQCDSGTFHEGDYCNAITSCAARADTHAIQACGNAQGIEELNSQHKVYWYDSDGNREDLVQDCGYPDSTCVDSDGFGGTESATCEPTGCLLEGECPSCDIQEFSNGDSICLNLYEGNFFNDARSKGLNEYILSCEAGEIGYTKLDRNSEVCIEGVQTRDNMTRRTASTISNNWGQCAGCGDSHGWVIDVFGYIPVLGAPIGALGNDCNEPNGWDKLGTLGLGETCKDRGKVEGESSSYEMCYYDHDLYAPIGSCNPVYPPEGTSKCGECGKGGDGFTNQCTIEECNHLGDCQFEHDNLDWDALALSAGIAAGTATAIVTTAWAICALPFVPCEIAYWSAVGTLLGTGGWISAVYWIGFSAIVGAGANLANPDPTYNFAFRNEDGSINAAWALALENSVAKELSKLEAGDDLDCEGIFQDEECGVHNVGRDLVFSFLGGMPAGNANAVVAYTLNLIGFELGSTFVHTLQGLGILVSTYTAAQALNTGSCSAEEAYTNNDRCGQCGGGEGQWVCTPDRCDILGASNGHCIFLEVDGPDNGVCVPVDVTDSSPPNVVEIEADLFDYEDNFVRTEGPVQSRSMDITERFEWPELNRLELRIKTDERAKCSYSFESGTEYESMQVFEQSDNFPMEHATNISVENLKSLGDIPVYIKCMDLNENKHGKTDDYNIVEVHFNEAPDVNPPMITMVSPVGNIRLPESTGMIDWIINVKENNGIAGCRFTQNNESTYDEMTLQFGFKQQVECLGADYLCEEYEATINLDETSPYEYVDLEEVTGVEGAGRGYTFYVSCKDGAGNFNNPSIPMGFVVVPTFELTILSPIEGSSEYEAYPLIEAEADSLVLCDYKMDGIEYNFSVDEPGFYYTYSTEHPDALAGSPSGTTHTLEITCRDDAANEVTKSIQFSVLQDLIVPKLVSIYEKSDKLFVVLDEEASCTYHTSVVEETEMINTINTFKHQLVLDPEILIYNINCADIWGNELAFTVYV